MSEEVSVTGHGTPLAGAALWLLYDSMQLTAPHAEAGPPRLNAGLPAHLRAPAGSLKGDAHTQHSRSRLPSTQALVKISSVSKQLLSHCASCL